MSKLTHLDESGAAQMVDVSQKESTVREATAEALIVLSAEAFAAAMSGEAPKGNVFATARIAGIMAAKKTSEMIPLCHQLALSKVSVEFEPLADNNTVRIVAMARTNSQTGVEMEALTAASVSALTIYDMVKAIDHGAVIEGVRLIAKSGGKSGDFRAPRRSEAPQPSRSEAARSATLRSKPAARTGGKPSALMGEVSGPAPVADGTNQREAFRLFMTNNRLRATEWAKQADVPVAQIYAYLTGRLRMLPAETAEKLARSARVRPEDMFARTRR